MTLAPPALLVDPTSDPIASAQWTVAYLTEVENLLADANDVEDAPGSETDHAPQTDAVTELVSHWIKFAPMNGSTLQTLHAKLPALGFTLKLSEPRGEAGPRTYVRVLRADGRSAGYLNATSFTFVGARHDAVVKEDARVIRGGRYPYLSLSVGSAVDLILDVAAGFAKG